VRVDGAVKQDRGLEAQRVGGFGGEFEHTASKAGRGAMGAYVEAEDRRTQVLDSEVEFVDRGVDPCDGGSTLTRWRVPCSVRPTPNTRWITLSCRSGPMRS